MEVIRHIQIPLEEGDHVVDAPIGAVQFGNMFWADGTIFIPVVLNPEVGETQYVITCIAADTEGDTPVWDGVRERGAPHTLLGAAMVKGSPMYVVEREGRLQRRLR